LLRYNSYKLTIPDEELIKFILKISSGELNKNQVIELFKEYIKSENHESKIKSLKPLPKDLQKRREILIELARQSMREKRKVYETLARY